MTWGMEANMPRGMGALMTRGIEALMTSLYIGNLETVIEACSNDQGYGGNYDQWRQL